MSRMHFQKFSFNLALPLCACVFMTIFENGNYFPTHSTREFVRFVNYIKMELRFLSFPPFFSLFYEFANDPGTIWDIERICRKTN